MKKIIFISILLLSVLASFSQSKIYIRGDSIQLERSGGNSELILLNGTRDSTGGVLYNKGSGRTAFRKSKVINDTTVIIGGDTIVIRGKGGAKFGLEDNSSTSNRLINFNDHSLTTDSLSYFQFTTKTGGSYPLQYGSFFFRNDQISLQSNSYDPSDTRGWGFFASPFLTEMRNTGHTHSGYVQADTTQIILESDPNRIYVYHDSVTIQNINNGEIDFRVRVLPTSTDTTTVKPAGIGANGRFFKMAGWPGSGGGSATLSNVGSGYRLVKTADGQVKTVFVGYGLDADSSTNTNALTFKADTTAANHLITQSDLNDAVTSTNIQYTNTAFVDSAYGDDGTGQLDQPGNAFASIDAALDAGASVGALHIKVGPGSYAKPTPSKMRSYLWIDGSGKPGHDGVVVATGYAAFSNTAPTHLSGGTIIKGTIQSVDHQFVKISNLGVDCGSTFVAGGGTEGNCIGIGSLTSSPNFTLMQGIEIRNVILLGKNPTSLFHGAVLENCIEPILDNVTTIFATHGIVGKNVGGIYTNLQCHDHHDDGIILKSNSYAYGFRMTLSNFEVNATWSTDAGGVWIFNEDGPALATTFVSDGVLDATTYGLKIQGTCNNIHISNVHSLRPTGNGISCTSDGIVNFRNCGTYASGADGWNISTSSGQTTISNCYSHANAGDAFDVGSTSGFVELENIFASSNTGVNVRAGSNVYLGEYKFVSGGSNVGTILPRKSAQMDRDNAFTAANSFSKSDNTNLPLSVINPISGSAIVSSFMAPNISTTETGQIRIGKNTSTRNFIANTFIYTGNGSSDNMGYFGNDSGMHVTANGRMSIGYNMGTAPTAAMTLDVNGKAMIKTVDSASSPVNMLYQDLNGEIKKAAVPSGGNGIYGGNGGAGGDGTLPGNTTVTGANNSLTFDDIFAFKINSDYNTIAKANGTGIFSEAIIGAGNIYEIGFTPVAGVFSKGAGVFIDSNENVGIGTQPPTTMPLYATGSSLFLQGLQSNHGNFYKVQNQTADFTASLQAYFYTIDATSGNVTVTLPAASTAFGNTMGIVYKFQRIDNSGNTVTIQRAGSDTINGGTSFTLTTQWGVKMMQCTSTSTWAQY